jgi:hypothetical protein
MGMSCSDLVAADLRRSALHALATRLFAALQKPQRRRRCLQRLQSNRDQLGHQSNHQSSPVQPPVHPRGRLNKLAGRWRWNVPDGFRSHRRRARHQAHRCRHQPQRGLGQQRNGARFWDSRGMFQQQMRRQLHQSCQLQQQMQLCSEQHYQLHQQMQPLL